MKKTYGQFIVLQVVGDRLVLKPTPAGVTEAQIRLAADPSGTDLHSQGDRALHEMLEDVTCNSDWEWIPAEAVGALTGAPILSQDMRLDDDGEWAPTDTVDGATPWAKSDRKPMVYAHMCYAIEDPVVEWAAGRSVTFQGAEVES